jgi:hypothetical protein
VTVKHPIGSNRRVWIAMLALLIGCTSSSATVPRTDAEGGEDAADESDGTLEADSVVGDASDGVDDVQAETSDQDGAGDDGPDGGIASDHDLCTGVCTVTAAVPICPESLSLCTKRCDAQFALGRCLASMRELARCETAAGPEAYDCVPGGIVPKPGVCETEIKATADCRKGDAGT